MSTQDPNFLEELTKVEREHFDKIEAFVEWAREQKIIVSLIVSKDNIGCAFMLGNGKELVNAIGKAMAKNDTVEEVILRAAGQRLGVKI